MSNNWLASDGQGTIEKPEEEILRPNSFWHQNAKMSGPKMHPNRLLFLGIQPPLCCMQPKCKEISSTLMNPKGNQKISWRMIQKEIGKNEEDTTHTIVKASLFAGFAFSSRKISFKISIRSSISSQPTISFRITPSSCGSTKVLKVDLSPMCEMLSAISLLFLLGCFNNSGLLGPPCKTCTRTQYHSCEQQLLTL